MADTVLIVEDEPDVSDLVVYHLQKAGFKTITARDGAAGLRKACDDRPGLVILDLMLPSLDGTDVCKRLKADPRTAQIPIIMLTAKADEVDRVLGLELGADDYVTKPFSPRELVLRVKTILRRAKGSAEPAEFLKDGELVVDIAKHAVTLKDKPIELTTTEFKLLQILAEKPGRVFSREQLLNRLWGNDKLVIDRTIDVHVKNLRDKLGQAGSLIKNIRAVGYKIDI